MPMTADDFVQILKIIVISVGGTGVIIIGVSAWLGKILSKNIYARTIAKCEKELEDIKNRYAVDFENLRSEMSERRDLLNSFQGMLSSSYMASHRFLFKSHLL